jgi:hypothetical protein
LAIIFGTKAWVHDADDVDREHRGDVVGRCVEQRVELPDAGVVDQRVAALDVLRDLAQRGAVGDVALVPDPADLLGGGDGGLGVEVEDDDGEAVARQALRGGLAQATPGSGDDCGLHGPHRSGALREDLRRTMSIPRVPFVEFVTNRRHRRRHNRKDPPCASCSLTSSPSTA